MELIESLAALKALAHPTRLGLYRALVQAGSQGLPVGALADQLAVPGSTLSAHLRVLRAAGLVLDAREGRVIRCRADYMRMDALLAYLTENCCAGAASCVPRPACKHASATTRPPRHETLPRARRRR